MTNCLLTEAVLLIVVGAARELWKRPRAWRPVRDVKAVRLVFLAYKEPA